MRIAVLGAGAVGSVLGLTVKIQDVVTALRENAPMLAGVPVVVLQNGLRGEELAAQVLPALCNTSFRQVYRDRTLRRIALGLMREASPSHSAQASAWNPFPARPCCRSGTGR